MNHLESLKATLQAMMLDIQQTLDFVAEGGDSALSNGDYGRLSAELQILKKLHALLSEELDALKHSAVTNGG